MKLHALVLAAAAACAVAPAVHAQTLRWAAQNDILTLDPHSQNHATTNAILMHAYEGLTRYNEKYEIVPDILEKVDVDQDRIFTLKIRKGHRWSDGHPFTAEDFRYFWDDVANNQRLTPAGVPAHLLVGGEKPKGGVRKLACRLKIARPFWTATTRRVEKLLPSRMRSTS